MFDKFTFDGKFHQLWSDSEINTFYGDPYNQIKIDIFARVSERIFNKFDWHNKTNNDNKIGNYIMLCDQLHTEPEELKKKILNYADIILSKKHMLFQWRKGLESDNLDIVKSLAEIYDNCHKLLVVCKELQEKFSRPLFVVYPSLAKRESFV